MKLGNSKLIGLTLLASLLLLPSSASATDLSQVGPAAQENVTYSNPFVIKAYKLIKQSKYEEAIDLLKLSLKRDPSNVEAHRYLAYSYLHVGKVADALGEAAKAIEDGIEHPHDAVAMGEAKFYTGEPKQAIGFYKEALLLNPLQIDARAGVIRCLMALGRFSEAKAICKQAAYSYQGTKGKNYFKQMLKEIDSKTQIASLTFGS